MRESVRIRTSAAQRIFLLTILIGAISPAVLLAQDYSDWTQCTGLKKIQYRWRANTNKGCDLEYRNTDDNDKRKYKSRVVFQIDGDEHEKPYTIVSFADPAPHLDSIAVCSEVTDISVTRF